MSMNPVYLQLEPRDPVVARDGRPFGVNQGRRMRSLDWPYPSTTAGSVRTAIGKLSPGVFPPSTVAALKRLVFGGPFPLADGQLYFPAPGDCVNNAVAGGTHRLVPRSYGPSEGTDLPSGLSPVLLPDQVGSFKFGPVPPWWSVERMALWLSQASEVPEFFFRPPGQFLQMPDKDERTHVQLDPETLTAADGMLFTTVGLVLDQIRRYAADGATPLPPSDTVLSLRIDPQGQFAGQWTSLSVVHPVGGERRLVNLRRTAGADTDQMTQTLPVGWQCPQMVREALAGAVRIRLVLASPAHFAEGWRPGWLQAAADGSGWCGCPPGSKVPLRLVGIANQRWRAVSGWSVETRGPKAIRRLVPAGGVYFFESLEPERSEELAGCWLASVSDDPVLHTEGFGLALWGIW